MVKFTWTDDLYFYNNEVKTPYGYEYIGKREILVRTNLSELVCTNILNSKNRILHSKGPMGTGKTETFKDYFRYAGRDSIIINCSETMTKENFDQLLDPVILEKRV